MNITDIRIKKNPGDTNVKAFVSITIDDALVINDFKVVESKHGLFLSMPSKKVGDQYIDITYPATAQMRSVLFDAVLNEYNRLA